MSFKPQPRKPIPEQTARIARAAFPKGNPYLMLRDELGGLYQDEDFADLFAARGHPAGSPAQLALVTVMQFRENLSDRQAAEAVRARIDWKYLLGLELDDAGFDYSLLSDFRARLVAGQAEARLLGRLLVRCHEKGLLKPGAAQRTDATHVLASIRVLNRLELVAETLRAALNDLADVAPDWLKALVPSVWYERYGRRIEDSRLPLKAQERERYARTVGEDGFVLLDALAAATTPPKLRALASIETLRQVWTRHYERMRASDDEPPTVQFKPPRQASRASEGVESPYDPQARYRSKRDGTGWTGYQVHLSETCDPDTAHLITHVKTTTAAVHEAQCTSEIQQALIDSNLSPREHLVDAGYITGEHLVTSEARGVHLIGPPRPNVSWQTSVEDGYHRDRFDVDWAHHRVRCPQGKSSASWCELTEGGKPYVVVTFHRADCAGCPARARCTRAPHQARHLRLLPQAHDEALKTARAWIQTDPGKCSYARRAGIEGTLSQAVRAFGLRRTPYRGLVKTHLAHLATAAAINLDRIFAWCSGVPRATTRTSRFLRLAA